MNNEMSSLMNNELSSLMNSASNTGVLKEASFSL